MLREISPASSPHLCATTVLAASDVEVSRVRPACSTPSTTVVNAIKLLFKKPGLKSSRGSPLGPYPLVPLLPLRRAKVAPRFCATSPIFPTVFADRPAAPAERVLMRRICLRAVGLNVIGLDV